MEPDQLPEMKMSTYPDITKPYVMINDPDIRVKIRAIAGLLNINQPSSNLAAIEKITSNLPLAIDFEALNVSEVDPSVIRPAYTSTVVRSDNN